MSDSGALQLRQLLVDATAGDYEIGNELGRGGMAVVYRATEVHLSRPVAIKILPPELTFTKGAAERFQREAKTAAALDHPNIIPIYRISSGGRLFWYAMKFLEGRSLAEVLTEKGLLTVAESVTILDQIGNALDYAHQHGVVHRDVKPGNVMLDVNGRVTMTDFGIAKELTAGALTGSGAILGTPYYMSPEQCRGGASITGAADQYSMAVMAYQMVCGQLPFEADSAIDVIHKHVAEQPPPLDQILPGLPKHVINAINRAMSKKAQDRFPTVQAFVSAMKNAPAEVTLVMEKRVAPVKPAQRRSGIEKAPTIKGSAGRIVVGTGIIGALVVGVLVLNNRMRDGEAANSLAATPTSAPSSAPTNSAGAQGPVGPQPTPSVPQPAPTLDAKGNARAAGARQEARRQAAAPTPAPVAAAATPPSAPSTRDTTAGTAKAPATAAPVTHQGYVRISITPTFADIVINGKTITERRGWADSLPAGPHTLIVRRTGYNTVTRSVMVQAGKQTEVQVTLTPSKP
ncbi:MAG TPA: serine/threonine-protein kinase [Gemmatimonadales bacterium]